MDSLIGQTLNRYQLTSLLGEGGMGAVFKARDITLLRDVAVKIMHPQFARLADFRERFLQEARTAARLNHAGIVQVYDFGQEKDLLYIVMEFIPGANLGQMLQSLRAQNQWIRLDEAIELMRQVALAMDFIHHQGVLHRDMKPGNIMLKPDPSENLPYHPVITDLGLAKLLEGQPMTQEGTSLGTPSYMSPEQALGQKVDARSDVYSLGILLYELSVGKLPFPIKSLTEAIRYHTQEPPPPPRSLRPDLPEILEKVILRALEKDPNQRIPNAAELARGLKVITPQISQVTEKPTLLENSVSLVTQYQQSMLEPRGVSILQEFEPPSDVTQDRIQVLADGVTTSSLAVKRGGMTAGRDAVCDIVLEDNLASRRHLKIDFDGTNYRVLDLGSTNGTFMGDAKLLPGVAEVWTPDKPLRVGRCWLRLVRAESQASDAPLRAGTLSVPAGVPQRSRVDPGKVLSSPGGGRVGIFIETSRLSVEPGSSAILTLTLINQGSVVDHFRVTVDGVPPSWVAEAEVVQLMPGAMQTVNLKIQPPKSPRSRAGDYALTVKAASQEAPKEAAQMKVALSVGVFSQFKSDLYPQKLRSGQAARLTVQNQGNRTEIYKLTCRDRGDELTFKSLAPQLQISEGQTGTAEFNAAPRQRKLIGGMQTYSFTVSVAPAQGEPQVHNGEILSKAILPAWVVPALLVLCLLLAGVVGGGSYWVAQNAKHATQTVQALAALGTSAYQTMAADAKAAARATAEAGSASATALAATARAQGDDDSDGLSNLQEDQLGTNPQNPDTDGDGLVDGVEVNQYGTNPKIQDSDGDTLSDGREINELKTSPLNKDTDGDGAFDNVDPDPQLPPTITPTIIPTTPAPPPDGVSMNCDNTYQRLRTEDKGIQGQALYLDYWEGTKWISSWNYEINDPNEQFFEMDYVGFNDFGECRKLLIVPVRHSGSGAYLDLNVYAWNGTTLVSIFVVGNANQGTWYKLDDTITVEYSVYLYNEPNCCPCNRQVDRYEWNGESFVNVESQTNPTYTGDPPAECQSTGALAPINPDIFRKIVITPFPIIITPSP
jgi:serine/threonine protein kinase